MKKDLQSISLLVLIVLLFGVLMAAPQTSNQVPLEGAPTPGISLNISGTICPSLTVTTGEKVTWTNRGRREHRIHIESSEGKLVFNSGVLQWDDSTSFTFSQAGIYSYVCTSDRGSTATITVRQ